MNKSIRDYGLVFGDMETGKNNNICDVKGVMVGHKTLDDGDIKTGVTAILPHSGNLFKNKVIGAFHVINGYGKSIGLLQIKELGTIETPVILTSTLSVGVAHAAVVDYMLKDNKDIGKTTATLNPIVCECNDSVLNDIRALRIDKEDVIHAIENANGELRQGSIGAGNGMVCYDLKGGIGSSSRVVKIKDKDYVIGILVLTNHGTLGDLVVNRLDLGKEIKSYLGNPSATKEKGSTIVVLATDIPLLSSQLERILKRVQSGIARTGAYHGIESGEIAIGFTTKNPVPQYSNNPFSNFKSLRDDNMDQVFKATIEATEEAIINSLVFSNTTIGKDNKKIMSLRDYIDKLDLI